jgi:hypothetical protein
MMKQHLYVKVIILLMAIAYSASEILKYRVDSDGNDGMIANHVISIKGNLPTLAIYALLKDQNSALA